jgi:hypothetical protein
MPRRRCASGVLALVCLFALSFTPSSAAWQAPVEDAPPVSGQPDASAAVPRLVRFSGALRTEAGEPRSGPVNLVFALYAEQEGGAPLWLESQNATLDAEGRYSVLLGADVSLPLELFSSGEARWLGVSVDGAERPRILLVSVPYALKAADAESLGGRPAGEFARLVQDEDGKTTLTSQDGVQILALSGGSESPMVTSGTANFIAKFINTTDLGDSVMFESAGFIGLGTTSPAAPLHVARDASLFSDAGAAVIVSGATTAARRLMLGYDENVNAGYIQSTHSGVDVRPLLFNPVGGAVGLGTINPQATMHVAQDSAFTSDLASALLVGHRSTPAKRMMFGFDAGINAGYIQSVESGVDVRSLVLNPGGGNVGIGATNPTQRLHVVGNILSSGTVTATSFSGGGAGLTGVAASTLAAGTHANAYNFSNASNTFTGDGSGLTNIPVSDSLRTRGINYIAGCDTCDPLTDADDQKTIYQNVIGAMTITQVTCFSDAGTPVINLQRDSGVLTNVLPLNLTCSTAGATSVADVTLNLTDKLNFVMVTAGGTAKRVTVVIRAVLN